MAAKCDMCGKMAKSYLTTGRGDIVCGKTCYDAYLLELYLLRLEEDAELDLIGYLILKRISKRIK